MKPILLLFTVILTILVCDKTASQNNPVYHSSSQTDTVNRYLISPIYSDTIFFIVNSISGDSTLVKGNIEGFNNRWQINYETYFQRFVEKRGNFRIIHAVGTGLETIKENDVERTRKYLFNDTISFDEAGIFEHDTTDPVSLIPLYPEHPVKCGEEWYPKAPVKISMGEGTADYVFKLDSVYMDEHSSLLALIKVQVTASLKPVAALRKGSVTVSGGGWLIWDCTINQRRETHLRVTYTGKNGLNEVQEVLTVNDELKVYEGRKFF